MIAISNVTYHPHRGETHDYLFNEALKRREIREEAIINIETVRWTAEECIFRVFWRVA